MILRRNSTCTSSSSTPLGYHHLIQHFIASKDYTVKSEIVAGDSASRTEGRRQTAVEGYQTIKRLVNMPHETELLDFVTEMPTWAEYRGWFATSIWR